MGLCSLEAVKRALGLGLLFEVSELLPSRVEREGGAPFFSERLHWEKDIMFFI